MEKVSHIVFALLAHQVHHAAAVTGAPPGCCTWYLPDGCQEVVTDGVVQVDATAECNESQSNCESVCSGTWLSDGTPKEMLPLCDCSDFFKNQDDSGSGLSMADPGKDGDVFIQRAEGMCISRDGMDADAWEGQAGPQCVFRDPTPTPAPTAETCLASDDSPPTTSFFVNPRTLMGSRRFHNGIRGTPSVSPRATKTNRSFCGAGKVYNDAQDGVECAADVCKAPDDINTCCLVPDNTYCPGGWQQGDPSQLANVDYHYVVDGASMTLAECADVADYYIDVLKLPVRRAPHQRPLEAALIYMEFMLTCDNTMARNNDRAHWDGIKAVQKPFAYSDYCYVFFGSAEGEESKETFGGSFRYLDEVVDPAGSSDLYCMVDRESFAPASSAEVFHDLLVADEDGTFERLCPTGYAVRQQAPSFGAAGRLPEQLTPAECAAAAGAAGAEPGAASTDSQKGWAVMLSALMAPMTFGTAPAKAPAPAKGSVPPPRNWAHRKDWCYLFDGDGSDETFAANWLEANGDGLESAGFWCMPPPVEPANLDYVKRFDGECKGQGVEDYRVFQGCHYSEPQHVKSDDNPGTTREEHIIECAKACSQLDADGTLDGLRSTGWTLRGFVLIPSTGRCWCTETDALTCDVVSKERHVHAGTDQACTIGDNGLGYERFDYVSLPVAPHPTCRTTDEVGLAGTATPSRQCIFPFHYDGKLFHGCTEYNNNGIAWCGTTSDVDIEPDGWGNCDVKNQQVGDDDDDHGSGSMECPFDTTHTTAPPVSSSTSTTSTTSTAEPWSGFGSGSGMISDDKHLRKVCKEVSTTVETFAEMSLDFKGFKGWDTSGDMWFGSSDLEFFDDDGEQMVGVQFLPIDIPQNARVVSAHISFVDDGGWGNQPLAAKIWAEHATKPALFDDDVSFDLTREGRDRTEGLPGGKKIWHLETAQNLPTDSAVARSDPTNCLYGDASAGVGTCWANSAFNMCPGDPHAAHDAVLASGPAGDNERMHSKFLELMRTNEFGCFGAGESFVLATGPVVANWPDFPKDESCNSNDAPFVAIQKEVYLPLAKSGLFELDRPIFVGGVRYIIVAIDAEPTCSSLSGAALIYFNADSDVKLSAYNDAWQIVAGPEAEPAAELTYARACPSGAYYYRFPEETSDSSDACTVAGWGGECWSESKDECIMDEVKVNANGMVCLRPEGSFACDAAGYLKSTNCAADVAFLDSTRSAKLKCVEGSPKDGYVYSGYTTNSDGTLDSTSSKEGCTMDASSMERLVGNNITVGCGTSTFNPSLIGEMIMLAHTFHLGGTEDSGSRPSSDGCNSYVRYVNEYIGGCITHATLAPTPTPKFTPPPPPTTPDIGSIVRHLVALPDWNAADNRPTFFFKRHAGMGKRRFLSEKSTTVLTANVCTLEEHHACRVEAVNSRSDDGVPCVFPFTYKGQTYSACTDVENDGVPWCATTNKFAKELHWGVCAEDCPIQESKPHQTCVTSDPILPPHDQRNCPHGEAHWETCWGDSAYHECTDRQAAYNAVMDGNSGDAEAMYAKYAELMHTHQFGCYSIDSEPALAGTQCVFPFVYQNVTYNGCTKANKEGVLKSFPFTVEKAKPAWCATVTNYDENAHYDVPSWGYCDMAHYYNKDCSIKDEPECTYFVEECFDDSGGAPDSPYWRYVYSPQSTGKPRNFVSTSSHEENDDWQNDVDTAVSFSSFAECESSRAKHSCRVNGPTDVACNYGKEQGGSENETCPIHNGGWDWHCNDGIHNGDETWTDCGGECDACDPHYIKRFDGECTERSEVGVFEGCAHYYSAYPNGPSKGSKHRKQNHTLLSDDSPGVDEESNIQACAMACQVRADPFDGFWADVGTPLGFVVVPSTGRCWCEADDADKCSPSERSLTRHNATDPCDPDTYVRGSGYERYDFYTPTTPTSTATSTATSTPTTPPPNTTPATLPPSTATTRATMPPIDFGEIGGIKKNIGGTNSEASDASAASGGDGSNEGGNSSAAVMAGGSVVGILIGGIVIGLLIMGVVFAIKQKKQGNATIDEADVMEMGRQVDTNGSSNGNGNGLPADSRRQAAALDALAAAGNARPGLPAPLLVLTGSRGNGRSNSILSHAEYAEPDKGNMLSSGNAAGDGSRNSYVEFPKTAGGHAPVDYLEPVAAVEEQLYGAANAVEEEDVYSTADGVGADNKYDAIASTAFGLAPPAYVATAEGDAMYDAATPKSTAAGGGVMYDTAASAPMGRFVEASGGGEALYDAAAADGVVTGAPADVTYDVAGGEELVGDGAAGFGGAPFAEPQYALGSAGDPNSLRMQSVHRTNPLNTLERERNHRGAERRVSIASTNGAGTRRGSLQASV